MPASAPPSGTRCIGSIFSTDFKDAIERVPTLTRDLCKSLNRVRAWTWKSGPSRPRNGSGKWSGLSRVRDLLYNRHEASRSLVRNASAPIHFPIPFAVVSDLQQSVFRIMPLPASRTHQISTPTRARAIVIFRHRKGRPAAARNEKHPWVWVVFRIDGIPH